MQKTQIHKNYLKVVTGFGKIIKRGVLVVVENKTIKHLLKNNNFTNDRFLNVKNKSTAKTAKTAITAIPIDTAVKPSPVDPNTFNILEALPCDSSTGKICAASDFGTVIPPDASERIILVLDGGGSRGFITVSFLKELEQHLKKNNIIKNRLQEILDVISGTSVGGILSLLMAKDTLSVTEIADTIFVNSFVQNIFNKKQNFIFRQLLLRPKYYSEPRLKVAKLLFGDTNIYDLPKKIIIPTVNLTKRKLHFWTNIGINPNPLVADIAMAASAAPTFFAAEQIKSFDPSVVFDSNDLLAFDVRSIMKDDNQDVSIEDWFVDGVIGNNSPSTPALIYARSLFPRENLRVISVGVGDDPITYKSDESRNAGGLWWLTKANIINIMLNVNTRVNVTQTKMSNPKDFLRLDVKLDKNLEIDIIDDQLLDSMKELGKTMFQENLKYINKFFKIE